MLALSFLKSRLFSLIKNTEFSSTDFLVSSSLCGHLSQRANNHALTPLHLPQPGWEIWVNLSFSLPPLSLFPESFPEKRIYFVKETFELGPNSSTTSFLDPSDGVPHTKTETSSPMSNLDLICRPGCFLFSILISSRQWSILPKNQCSKQVYPGYLWDEQGKHFHVSKCH